MGFNSGFKGLIQEICNFPAGRQRAVKCSIPVSFDFINTWNQGVFLCSPCICIRTRLSRHDRDWIICVLINEFYSNRAVYRYGEQWEINSYHRISDVIGEMSQEPMLLHIQLCYICFTVMLCMFYIYRRIYSGGKKLPLIVTNSK